MIGSSCLRKGRSEVSTPSIIATTDVVRTNTVEITYYDGAMSNGVQKLLLSRQYTGGFDRLGINSDECQIRVHGADGFKLSGGVFLP